MISFVQYAKGMIQNIAKMRDVHVVYQDECKKTLVHLTSHLQTRSNLFD